MFLTCRRSIAIVVAFAVLAVGAAGATASPQFKQTVRGSLFTRTLGQPTGLGYQVRIVDPGAPRGVPKSATRIVIKLPAGTVYDPRGAPSCRLAEAMARDDCPRDTRLSKISNGEGMGVNLGSPDAVAGCRYNARIFHLRGDGLLFFHDGPCRPRLASTADISKDGVLTIPLHEHVATPPAAVSYFTVSIGRRVRRGRPLFRTPTTCNRRRGWRTRTTVTYEDGSTETTITKQKCGRRER